MYVKQFVGPFSKDINPFKDLNKIRNRKLVQIGIERPHSIPISEENTQKIILKINDQSFSIGETDILDVSSKNILIGEVDISVQEISNPYLIIDIAYE